MNSLAERFKGDLDNAKKWLDPDSYEELRYNFEDSRDADDNRLKDASTWTDNILTKLQGSSDMNTKVDEEGKTLLDVVNWLKDLKKRTDEKNVGTLAGVLASQDVGREV